MNLYLEGNILRQNLDKIHTTEMGVHRIQKNLDINCDVVEYCKKLILKDTCCITHKGKNWYCEVDSICITINASSYTIITAHVLK